MKRGLNSSEKGTGDLFKSNQYKRFIQNEYDIFLQSYTIKKYLTKLIEVQEVDNWNYYPADRNCVISYCDKLSHNFSPEDLRYKNENDLLKISRYIMNLGKSGINYINSVDYVTDLNKPEDMASEFPQSEEKDW